MHLMEKYSGSSLIPSTKWEGGGPIFFPRKCCWEPKFIDSSLSFLGFQVLYFLVFFHVVILEYEMFPLFWGLPLQCLGLRVLAADLV